MITILYGNIQEVKNKDIDGCLQLLPESMSNDILRYKYVADQKARMVARLMLFKCLKDAGKSGHLNKWERDQYGKPFIEGWEAFNISHSGDLVVLCHAPIPIGIDIEKELPIEHTGMLEHLHAEEREFIIGSENSQQAFYRIWTKKEAFLKAIGLGITGITNGLEAFNCTHESIMYQNNDWYFYEVPFQQGYSCYLCCSNKEDTFHIKAFDFGFLSMLLPA